jgi:hypothetical protein
MKYLSIVILPIVSIFILYNTPAFAMETAPHISDLEIVERLTRLEEGQGALREEVKQLREDMNKQFDRVDAQFNRADAQFDRIVNIMLGILGAFAAMCGGTIWFALWDRRTMIRPFEDKVKKIEDDISENRNKLHTLLE